MRTHRAIHVVNADDDICLGVRHGVFKVQYSVENLVLLLLEVKNPTPDTIVREGFEGDSRHDAKVIATSVQDDKHQTTVPQMMNSS